MKKATKLNLIRRQLAKENAKRPPVLTKVPEYHWPEERQESLIEVWLSKRFLVQVHQEKTGLLRLSCNRTSIDQFGAWEQNLTWDDLMEIKRQIGRGESYAVEVLPEDSHIVNVDNMRHIWILPSPVCGWRKG